MLVSQLTPGWFTGEMLMMIWIDGIGVQESVGRTRECCLIVSINQLFEFYLAVR